MRISGKPLETERIERAWRLAAKIALSNEIYLPLFERLDKEMERIRKNSEMLEKARITAMGGEEKPG